MLRDFPDTAVAVMAGAVPPPRRRDASRAHLLASLDNTLRRLRRSHIDVWQVSGWDAATPLAETLSVLDFAVTSGRVRYAGVANYSGWQLAAACLGSASVVSTQMEYSLVQRGIEREVLPAAANYGAGLLAWSPLGRGVLTGRYRHATPADSRGASPQYAPFIAPYLEPRPRAIVEAVCTAADGLGWSPAHVALSWLLARPGVSAALVGPRTATQLRVFRDGRRLVVLRRRVYRLQRSA